MSIWQQQVNAGRIMDLWVSYSDISCPAFNVSRHQLLECFRLDPTSHQSCLRRTLRMDLVQELTEILSQLSTQEQKVETARSFIERFECQGPRVTTVRAASRLASTDRALCELLLEHGISPPEIAQGSRSTQRTPFIMDAAPCAYTIPSAQEECLNIGVSACSSCRLVKYCSKVRRSRVWYGSC